MNESEMVQLLDHDLCKGCCRQTVIDPGSQDAPLLELIGARLAFHILRHMWSILPTFLCVSNDC